MKLHDHVIYPSHGVAVIKKVDKKTVGGREKDFFVLEILHSQMTILVSKDQTDQVGLRPVLTKTAAKQAISKLRNLEVKIYDTTWNRRYREYMELLKTGNTEDIMRVFKSLSILNARREMSFGERKMLDWAKELLALELSVSMKVEKLQVEDMLMRAVA